MAQIARRASTARNAFPARPGLMLVLATAGFALNFWAWALLSPLGPRLKVTLHLSAFSEALLVALPVVVGAVGRIPIGAMTDRFGGRVMLPAVSLAAVVPVLFLGVWGHTSYAGALAGGLFLGIAGTSFAVGVPFVSSWFPPAQRGFALGIFGAGMGGTAISALTTVHLASALGVTAPFVLVAAMLVLYSAVAIVLMRDAPMSERSHASFNRRLRAAMELSITWRAAILYAVGFGGYVAFSVYLPTYLKNAYLLTQSDAANRMAGFVLTAVIMRPVGGWLSDRVQPGRVLTVAFAMVAAAAVAQSGTPALIPSGTVAMLAMAAALGISSGAVFALVGRQTPSEHIGGVTGVVGAAGGLGGFVPPLIMGSTYGRTGAYTIGLLALAVVAAGVLVLSARSAPRLSESR